MRASQVLVLDDSAEVIVADLRQRVSAEVELVTATTAREASRAERAEVCLARPDLFAEVADRLPGIRWVQSTWAGVSPLLPVLAQRPALQVTAARGIFGDAIAEYVLGWLIALDRNLLRYAQQQRDGHWGKLPERPLAGRKATVLGAGSIGRRVAERLAAFGIEVVGVSRSGRQQLPFARTWASVDRARAARHADILVSVLPQTPATRGVVDASLLAVLAPGAIVFNVGRGDAVNEDDLLAALRARKLSAAVLDVFDVEPLPQDHVFWTTPGVYVTPHVAAVTRPEEIGRLFARNFHRWREGRPLEYLVDADRGY